MTVHESSAPTRGGATATATALTGAGGIPSLGVLDSTTGFLADGYEFGRRRFDRVGDDAFRTRLMGRPVTVVFGAEAARAFGDGRHFSRERALPSTVQHLLQDKGSVQTLEDEPHRHRKSLFIQVLQPEQLERLRERFAAEWHAVISAAAGAPLAIADASAPALTRAALAWCGIPPAQVHTDRLSAHLVAMIDNAARIGPAHWRARMTRRRTERWAAEAVEAVRNGRLPVADDAPIAVLARHTDAAGHPLPVAIAAVELLNLLRPIVAVSRFLAFTALALIDHPEWRARLRDGYPVDRFVNEVRRTAPFFPVVGGTARTAFEWRGSRLEAGDWMLLDLWATNHDPRSWRDPDRFDPDRFADWDGDVNALIPQGAGSLEDAHRCPGEGAAITLMGEFARSLAEAEVEVPGQDFTVDLRRFPALPADHVRIAFPAA
ncbi:MAG TPA: cytochrome P450 [Agromyces sp.]|nr:cytochrome P450 [Agromyces sp.]